MLNTYKSTPIKMLFKALFLLVLLNLSQHIIADQQTSSAVLPIYSGVGGEFSAIDGKGKNINLSDYKGKVIVLAFGYTNCADICPFTLGYLKQLYATLSSEEQKQTHIIFVTIDPEYDTPEHLHKFVTFFNKSFIGLSGSKQQIEHITSLYKAEYSDLSQGKVSTKDIRRTTSQKTTDSNEKASLFSHTVVLYLIDKEGLTRSLEYTGTPKDEFATKIRTLIHEE